MYREIEKLIKNNSNLILQKSLKNFFLTDKYISKMIDDYRDDLLASFKINLKIKNIEKIKISRYEF